MLTIKKDGSLIWNNKEIEFTNLKSLLSDNDNIIINIDKETSIQNFNKVIKKYLNQKRLRKFL